MKFESVGVRYHFPKNSMVAIDINCITYSQDCNSAHGAFRFSISSQTLRCEEKWV